MAIYQLLVTQPTIVKKSTAAIALLADSEKANLAPTVYPLGDLPARPELINGPNGSFYGISATQGLAISGKTTMAIDGVTPLPGFFVFAPHARILDATQKQIQYPSA